MKKTGAAVHFPDSNTTTIADKNKSNQVSIAGSLSQIEEARELIRQSAPCLLSFELHLDKEYRNKREMEAVANKYGVDISIHKRSKPTKQMILIKGLEIEWFQVMQATEKLKNSIFKKESLNVPVEVRLIPPKQGYLNESQISKLMQMTNTKIEMPDPDPSKSRQLKVFGAPEDVFKAHQMLLKSLPVTLRIEFADFRLHDDIIRRLMVQHQVIIRVSSKKHRKQSTITISGIENNLQNIYMACLTLLDLATDEKDPAHDKHHVELPKLFDRLPIKALVKNRKLMDEALFEVGYTRNQGGSLVKVEVNHSSTDSAISRSSLAAASAALDNQPPEHVAKTFQVLSWLSDVQGNCNKLQTQNVIPFNGSLAPGSEYKHKEQSKSLHGSQPF